jgi:hypothetical protein
LDREPVIETNNNNGQGQGQGGGPPPPSEDGSSSKGNNNKKDTSYATGSPTKVEGASLTTSEYTIVHGSDLSTTFTATSMELFDDYFNTTNVHDWKLGIYMRMANPQRGSLEPIVALPAGIEYSIGGSNNNGNNNNNNNKQGDDGYKGTVTFSSASVSAYGTGRSPTWPTSLSDYGTGYDIWLLDENGVEVYGPTTFYVQQTQEQLDEIQKQEDTLPKHGLVKFNHGATKKKQYGKGKGKGNTDTTTVTDGEGKGQGNGGGKGQGNGGGGGGKGGEDTTGGGGGHGYGKGKNGGQIIGATQSLGDYALDTDKMEYLPTDPVVITYSLPEGTDEFAKTNNQHNSNSNNGGKYGNSGKNADGVFENDISVEVVIDPNDSINATDGVINPDIDTPVVDVDTSIEDEGIEDETAAADNLASWTIGIYMRMAHPQKGALPPIVSIPLCGKVTCEGSTQADIDALLSGSVTFDSSTINVMTFADQDDTWPLDSDKYGTGFDVWILDGLGNGMAGPREFHIPSGEESGQGDEDGVSTEMYM